MEELKRALVAIDALLARIPVRGDAVLLMAEARQALKAAHDAVEGGESHAAGDGEQGRDTEMA